MHSKDNPAREPSRLAQETRGIVALDVGGTTIQSGIVCESARVMESTALRSDARSGESTMIILGHITEIIEEQRRRARVLGTELVGVGLAFPGPFDYENGICLIQGLHKFDSIFGINLRQHFSHALDVDGSLVSFMNDADAFAVGECFFGVGQEYSRALYLTLGTGIGSTFIDAGRIVNDHAPYDGRIFQAPFREGVADDYLSRRGILRLAAEVGYTAPDHDVVDISKEAIGGDAKALMVFERFSECIAAVLRPICQSFKPDGIVLGGQISKSSSLFLPKLKTELSPWSGQISTTTNGLHSTWRGLYHQFFEPLAFGKRVVAE